MSMAQMDFVLEMYSRDHPDELKFNRAGDAPPPAIAALLSRRLTGRALAEFMGKRVNVAAGTAKALAASTPQWLRDKLKGRPDAND
jgi:hypothetical protein